MIADGRTEFGILLDLSESEIADVSTPEIASAIIAVRKGDVDVKPGYDGEYGVIRPRAKHQIIEQKGLF